MPDVISSPQNPRIKELASLRRKREVDSPILIDGVREISRAAGAGLKLVEVFYCPALLTDEMPSDQLQKLKGPQTEFIEVTEPVFEKIRYGDRTGGIVAIALRPHRTLAELMLSPNPLIAVVEQIGKPGNLGGMLRSADGAGVEAILVVDSAIDIYGPNVIRASVAAVFRIPVVELTVEDARRFLSERGMQAIAASPAGESDYTSFDYRKATAFIFGAEDRGLSDRWAGLQTARVPMRGLGDSLNVSTTAAVFFYEALRQRSQ